MKKNEESLEKLNFTANIPIEFDQEVCIGCNQCVEACMMDVLAPNAEKGKVPLVFHPDECWYCGSCVMECPCRDKDAIKVKWPIKTNLRWKRKDTGEHYRVGMANPPPPNLTPPVGGWGTLHKAKK
jgi:NAD-dependent dihydropyrimidine dehydrogenase PreA subunit